MKAQIKIEIVEQLIVTGEKPKAEFHLYYKGMKSQQVVATLRAMSQKLKKGEYAITPPNEDGFIEIVNR